MTWEIPESLPLWQLVASIVAMQNQQGGPGHVFATAPEHIEVLAAAGMPPIAGVSGTYDLVPARFRYEETAQAIIRSPDMPFPYPEALAMDAGMKLPRQHVRPTAEEMVLGIRPASEAVLDLKLQWASNAEPAGIVVCPYTFQRDLELPVPAWHAIITMLRMFGEPVYLLSGPGQRFDSAKFAENQIISEENIMEKLAILATARLIVGVPNEWLWLATAWRKPMVYFYPDTLPPRRWFWQPDDIYGRCVFTPEQVQVPLILAGLRMLINGF